MVDLDGPHHVLSTSARNGGQADHVRHLVNHQSCEGTGHDARAHVMPDGARRRYHDAVCAEIGVAADADRGDGHGGQHELRGAS